MNNCASLHLLTNNTTFVINVLRGLGKSTFRTDKEGASRSRRPFIIWGRLISASGRSSQRGRIKGEGVAVVVNADVCMLCHLTGNELTSKMRLDLFLQ